MIGDALHSIQAEQSVLGGLLLDNCAWDDIADLLSEADFFRRDHRLIFQAIGTLIDRGDPCDVVTLAEWLESQQQAEEAGGLAYVGTLAKDTPSAANIRAYAQIVRDKAVERRLFETAGRLGEIARGPGDTADKLDQAQAMTTALIEQGQRKGSGLQAARAILPRLIDALDERLARGGAILGLSTGWPALDKLTAGLHPGDLVVVAGRPSMGKTTFAMNIAEHAALKDKIPVAVFSLEMTADQLLERQTAAIARIGFQHLRRADLDDSQWSAVTRATSRLAEAPLFIDDTADLTVTDLRARARRLRREHGLGLVVVDYLQLMRGQGDNRTLEITRISQGLKALAKELSVPVIALSQLNRSLEQRTDRRPRMSDLRESGAIEQDADLILFIYRDEVYDEDSPRRGIAEIIIGKQRNGPTGTVHLAFLGEFLRFENLAGPVPDVAPAKEQWRGGFDYSEVGT
ncbi:MAG TPA: replicative DNA helicase [Sedimenticola sp.]|nr:replicative DNA helicase [Sedimenticola sp.]